MHSSNTLLPRFITVSGFLGVVAGSVLLAFGAHWWAGVAWIIAFSAGALRLRTTREWQPFSFSCWVLACVSIAMFFPNYFATWWLIDVRQLPSLLTGVGEPWIRVDPTKQVSLLIQIIMFGMGTTLGLSDFLRVLTAPRAILIGMLLQFGIMPLVGFLLALAFYLPPEIAAGVVLIGSCPGGVASNLIAYLARGDVALSVTMTACSTLLSPLLTPLMMWLLAGTFVHIDFVNMLITIIGIIIVPTAAGIIANTLLQSFGWRGPWVDRFLSGVAMLAICLVIGIIVAQSRDKLLEVGPVLILVAVLHNACGYLFGYFGARVSGFEERACRTIAIEVGMQNGGMATALATSVLNAPPAALAGAVFGPWMSISGSVLASWWGRHPAAGLAEQSMATEN